MRLTKLATLKDLKDTAGLQAWSTAQQLEQGDLSPFQRAFFMNELAAAFLQLSIDIMDANDLATMMAEVKPTVVEPVKARPKPKRTRKPPAKAPAPPTKKTLPPKKLRPRKKSE